MTEADRRDVQTALARLGYYDGGVDGLFGSDTRAAIRRWQHEVGAEMTGTLSGEQATGLVSQQVPLTMGGGNAPAQVHRHVWHTPAVTAHRTPATRAPPASFAAPPPPEPPQTVTRPARPRPWWQFW